MIRLVGLGVIAVGALCATDGEIRVENMADAVAHCATVGTYDDTKDCVLDAYKSFGSDGLDVCDFEDSIDCIWYGEHGQASFIDVDGYAYYLPASVYVTHA